MPGAPGSAEFVAAELERFCEREVGAMAIATAASLFYNTPVASGYARSNWAPTIGAPDFSETGSKQAPSESRFNAGLAAFRTYRFKQGNLNITNNVPYIGRLSRGWSAQAPSGWIERIIARSGVFTGGVG